MEVVQRRGQEGRIQCYEMDEIEADFYCQSADGHAANAAVTKENARAASQLHACM